ncbi:hypothetical protein IDVR_03930 [Intrasporangium sp. DVR]
MILDVLPNVALYAPLGFGLAALGLGARKLTLLSGLTAAMVELAQAVVTDRVCAPRDVFANVLGTLFGAFALACCLVRLGGVGPGLKNGDGGRPGPDVHAVHDGISSGRT